MTPLQRSVLQTVIYFDLFDFAPTSMELYRYLLTGPSSATLHELEDALRGLSQLQCTQGFVHMVNRKDIAMHRHERTMYTEEKYYRDAWILWLLSALPGVRGVWICNTVGWGNTHAQSDTDLCIVAAQGRMWTARACTTALLKLLRRRPGECARERALCPSFYITDALEDLGKYRIDDQDIHFAFWITQMTPWYNRELFLKWTDRQAWGRQFFMHNPFIIPARRRTHALPRWIEWTRRSIEAICPEQWLKHWQLKHFSGEIQSSAHTGVVVLNDAILKLHTHDSRDRIRQRFYAACLAHSVPYSRISR